MKQANRKSVLKTTVDQSIDVYSLSTFKTDIKPDGHYVFHVNFQTRQVTKIEVCNDNGIDIAVWL